MSLCDSPALYADRVHGEMLLICLDDSVLRGPFSTKILGAQSPDQPSVGCCYQYRVEIFLLGVIGHLLDARMGAERRGPRFHDPTNCAIAIFNPTLAQQAEDHAVLIDNDAIAARLLSQPTLDFGGVFRRQAGWNVPVGKAPERIRLRQFAFER